MVELDLVKKIMQRLISHGYQARVVGGAVRDHYLKRAINDFDIATDATPDQVCSLFTSRPYTVIPTGVDHGTVTVRAFKQSFEVTTLRSDVSTDGRRAVVKFTKDFKEDAIRRDFTMNAMSQSIDGEIFDYFDGQKDLDQKIIRFVGDPATRINEDRLRMMRFYRFLLQLQLTTSNEQLQVIENHLSFLPEVSKERITDEFQKILTLPQLYDEKRYASLTPLFSLILGTTVDLAGPTLITLDKISNSDISFCFIARLSFLISLTPLIMDGKNFGLLKLKNHDLSFLKMMSIVTKKIDSLSVFDSHAKKMDLLDEIESASTPQHLPDTLSLFLVCLDYHKVESACQNLLSLQSLEKTSSHRRTAKLPIDGRDVITRSDMKGQQVGIVLNTLRDSYRNEEWSTREEGLERLDKLIKISP